MATLTLQQEERFILALCCLRYRESVRGWLLWARPVLPSLWCFLQKNQVMANSIGRGALHCQCGGDCPFRRKAFKSLLGEHQMENVWKKEQSIIHSFIQCCLVGSICTAHFQVVVESNEAQDMSTGFHRKISVLFGKKILHIRDPGY